jgi:hypothetical protein
MQSAIVARLVAASPKPGQAVPFTNRQIDALAAARAALQCRDIPRARSALRGV